jgi:hypothetical protein
MFATEDIYFLEDENLLNIFNRPDVAGAVLQSPLLLTDSFIHSLTHPLVQIFSKHCQSQTGRARELKI